jgi:hypothetical protein
MTGQTSLFAAEVPSTGRHSSADLSRPTTSRSRASTASDATSTRTRYWIGVVSAEHVRRGVSGGFAQLCHGKAAPLRRMRPGDWLVYYSPAERMGGGEPVQAFTAIGRVRDGSAYECDMGGGFVPFRRDVGYLPCRAAPIRPLLAGLAFLPSGAHWGYVFRRGHVEITEADFLLIARAMGVDPASVDPAIEPSDGRDG